MTELRLKKGVSYQEVAHKAGTSDRYMHRIETGDANPSMAVLQAVADYHKIRLSRLIAMAEAKYARRKRPKK